MKDFKQLYKWVFAHKKSANLTIFYNLLFVIFNLISLLLFIPFLQLIFKETKKTLVLKAPVLQDGFFAIFNYIKDYYNYYMQSMVNEDPKRALVFVCITVFMAFFLKNVFRYGAVWHQSHMRMAVVRDLRNQLFEKSLNLPLSFYTDEKKGDLMARMQSDVGEIEVAVVYVLEFIFREPIAIIITVATLFYLSPQLTIFSFILLPITAFVISRIGKSLKKTAKAGQEQMGVVFSAIDEGLGGIRVVKAFNGFNQVFNSFKVINLKHQQLITKTFRKKDVSPLLNEALGSGVMMLLVWFGGSMILDAKVGNDLSGEVFITFVIVFSQLMRPISGISSAIASFQKAKVSQDRINEIIHMDEKIYEQANPIPLTELKNSIRYENVSFKYKDDFVLKNIDLTINKGKTIALVGESGSGKSTMGDLLARFYDVNEGTIFFDDTPIQTCSLTDLRNHIGIVSQESILFNTSVRENIAFGMENATIDAIMNAAKIANAHEFIMQLENGYETNIGERGNKLSGGQKQRISIARAILKNPTVLVLDEATSALDTESEKLVQDALDHLMKDRTSIIIAHRLSTIRNADEIIVLSKGEIKERGQHSDLLALKGMYYNLCTLQGLSENVID
jgi:subfamily B ATP-binding cassette protein MsbA